MTFRLAAPSVTPISETLALFNAKVFFFCRTAAFPPPRNVGRRERNAARHEGAAQHSRPGRRGFRRSGTGGQSCRKRGNPLKHPGSLAENARDLAQEPLSAVREHGDGAGEVPQQEGEKLKRKALADGLDGMPGNLPGGFFGKKG